MKRARIIYNPTSGREIFKKNLPEVLQKLEQAGYETSCHATTCAGDATEAAKVAVERRFDVVIAAGGDGTINEVVNGIAGQDYRPQLGIIPVGTTNDFARAINVPRTIEGAIDVIVEGVTKPIDLGCVTNDGETHYFVNIAGGGRLTHMLEVDPTLAVNKPKLIVSPLGIGNREDPARLVFDGKQGEGVVVSMADFGTHYKLLINEVSAFEPEVPAPNLPVARVLWNIKPNFQDGVKAWIENGGGHHTVLSLNLTTDQIVSYAKLVDLEYVIIK